MSARWPDEATKALDEAARLMRVYAAEHVARNGCVIVPARGWVFTSACPIESLRGAVFGRLTPSLMVRVDREGGFVPLIAQGPIEPDPFSSKGIRSVGAGMVVSLDSDLELALESVEAAAAAFLAKTRSLVDPDALAETDAEDDDRHEAVEMLRARAERERGPGHGMRSREYRRSGRT
jgi:hypothetical protein